MDALEKIINGLAANGDKIGMGAVAIVLVLALLYSLRFIFGFIQKNQEITAKVLAQADDIADLAKTTKQVGENIITSQVANKEAAEQHTSTLKDITISFQDTLTTFSREIVAQLGASSQNLVMHIDTTKADILNALSTRSLLEIPKGVVVLSASGRLISANQDALDLVGTTKDKLVGSNVRDWLNTMWDLDGRQIVFDDHPFAQALKSREPVRNNIFQYRHPETFQIKWFLVDAEPTVREDSVVRVIVSFREIGQLFVTKTDTTELNRVNTNSNSV